MIYLWKTSEKLLIGMVYPWRAAFYKTTFIGSACNVNLNWCVSGRVGSSVSLGADLLSIYDDARRSLDVLETYDADAGQSCTAADYDSVDDVDGDCVEMLPVEEHGNNSESNSGTVGSTRSPDGQAAAAFQRRYCEVDERSCKRPLSVSSTSSSMSSTSSLPRHEPKKLATAVQSPLPGVEDASPGCRDGETGCLSTVAEYVPAAAERCRLADGRLSPASGGCLYDGGGDLPSAAIREGNDINDNDNDEAGVVRNTATTLSRSQYVGRVIAEIIDTERAYVADLDQIIHVRTTIYIYTFDHHHYYARQHICYSASLRQRRVCLSVRTSVCHTPVLCIAERQQDREM